MPEEQQRVIATQRGRVGVRGSGCLTSERRSVGETRDEQQALAAPRTTLTGDVAGDHLTNRWTGAR